MQPWDGWEGYKSQPVSQWSEKDYLLMDKLASYVLCVDQDLEGLRRFIEEQEKIKVPEDLSKVINFIA